MVPSGTIKTWGSKVLFRCSSCGAFGNRLDTGTATPAGSRGTSQIATLEVSVAMLPEVFEPSFAAPGVTVTFAETILCCARICDPPKYAANTIKLPSALKNLFISSSASKRIPQAHNQPVSDVCRAVKGVGLHPLIFHGEQHIRPHSINKINKWTLVPGNRVTVIKRSRRKSFQFPGKRYVFPVGEVYFEIGFRVELQLHAG